LALWLGYTPLSLASSRRFCRVSIIEGSLEVKLPTIWADEATGVRAVREEPRRRKKIREEKESKEKMKEREKVEKSRNAMFFQSEA